MAFILRIGFFICFCATPLVAAEDRQLTGSQIQAILSGNTMSTDDRLAEYHGEDGFAVIRSPDNAGKMSKKVGRWQVKRDTVCYKYLDEPEATYCWRVYQLADGAIYLWGTENQIIFEVILAKGDPRKLQSGIDASARAKALSLRL